LDCLSYVPRMNRVLVDKLIQQWREDPTVGAAFAGKMKTYFDKCTGVVGRRCANLLTWSGVPSTNNGTESGNRRDKKMLVTAHGLVMHLGKMVSVTHQLSTKYSSWSSILRRDVWSQNMWGLVSEYLDFQVHQDCPTTINVVLCAKQFNHFNLDVLDRNQSRTGGSMWKVPDHLTKAAATVLIVPGTKCLRQLITTKCSTDERRQLQCVDVKRMLWNKTPGDEQSWGKQFIHFVQNPDLYTEWDYKDYMSWLQSFTIMVAFERHEEQDMMEMLIRFERGIPAEASGLNTNGATVNWDVLETYRANGGMLFRCLCGDFLSRTCCLHVLSHLTHFKILRVPCIFSAQRLHSSQRPSSRPRLLQVGEALSTRMTGPLVVEPEDDDFKQDSRKSVSGKRKTHDVGAGGKRVPKKTKSQRSTSKLQRSQKSVSTKQKSTSRVQVDTTEEQQWLPSKNPRRSPRLENRAGMGMGLSSKVPDAASRLSSRTVKRVLTTDLQTSETWTGDLSQVLRDTFDKLQTMRRQAVVDDMRDNGIQCQLMFEDGVRGWHLRNAGREVHMGEVVSILSYGPVCEKKEETGVPPGKGVMGWECRGRKGGNVTKYQGWNVEGWTTNKCGCEFGAAANEGSSKADSNAEILRVKPSATPEEWYTVITATKHIPHGQEVLVWYGDNSTGWTHRTDCV